MIIELKVSALLKERRDILFPVLSDKRWLRKFRIFDFRNLHDSHVIFYIPDGRHPVEESLLQLQDVNVSVLGLDVRVIDVETISSLLIHHLCSTEELFPCSVESSLILLFLFKFLGLQLSQVDKTSATEASSNFRRIYDTLRV